MAKSYLFYDVETSGLNHAFDQIVQFAAIRTDEEFQAQEEHNILIRLRPDVVPAPAALLTHRIMVEETLLEGIPEYEAMLAIHRLLNRAETISIGYNSLAFDDQFLRFSFYRNLLPPYTHQWANGCGRMDLFPITIMYHLFRPESVHWPRVNGEVRLKLELLSEANELAQGRAHDALVDVRATVALARRLRAADPAFWEECASYFDKKADEKRPGELEEMANLEGYPAGMLVHPRIGRQDGYNAPVLYLGPSEAYGNQTLWLRLDDPSLAALTPETVAESTVIRKKLGELGFVLPPSGRMEGERRQRVVNNVGWLRRHRELLEVLADFHRHYRYPDVPDVDADAALYQGFMSEVEQVRCQRFHEAPLREKVATVADGTHFGGTTQTLAERVLARNYGLGYRFPTYRHYLQQVVAAGEIAPPADYRGRARRTPDGALDEIAELRAEGGLDEADCALLDDLEAYLRHTFTRPAGGKA